MRVAVAQFAPDSDPEVNSRRMTEFAARAAAAGADLLLLPEGSLVRFVDDPPAATRAAQPVDGGFGAALVAASATYSLVIAAGSFTPHGDRIANTLLIADRGRLVATYDKVHLYDAFDYLESDSVSAGSEPPPVVEIAGVAVGFATCYDLRFPELFRLLTDRGAQVLAIASAWVSGPLKEEQWLTLLKARAIENTCYVVAADQTAHRTIGRSAAFDPMGLPMLDLGTEVDVLGLVEIDVQRLASVRQALPCLANRRFSVRAD